MASNFKNSSSATTAAAELNTVEAKDAVKDVACQSEVIRFWFLAETQIKQVFRIERLEIDFQRLTLLLNWTEVLSMQSTTQSFLPISATMSW